MRYRITGQSVQRAIIAPLKTTLMVVARGLRHRTLRMLAIPVGLYRRSCRGTMFIGITGSCGKTTTKEMMHAVLSTKYRGQANRGTRNTIDEIMRGICRVRRDDQFCIQELSVGGLGEAVPIEQQAQMLKPQMVVVTNVGSDHISALGSLDAIAESKSKSLSAVPASGVVILNADDPRVMGMRAACKCRVLTYGASNDALVRASNITSKWPQGLRFTLHHADESQSVQMSFYGVHWVPCALAATAVGLEMKLTLQEVANALEAVLPVEARLSSHHLPNGITMLRDDWKAPLWTVPASLRVMRDATAQRRIIIVGTISDYRGDASSKYVRVAREAVESAEHVIFVGPWASRCLRVRTHAGDDRVRAFPNVSELIPFLKEFLEPGDLVLLKGSHATDRLDSIVGQLKDHPVEENGRCNRAQERGHDDSDKHDGEPDMPKEHKGGRRTQYVIGLGNPGKEFQGTPHNVGYTALDLLAQEQDKEWVEDELATTVRIRWDDREVCLVKPRAEMNRIGTNLAELQEREGFETDDMILIQDDLQIDIGRLKTRMKGSAGGHKGVASIISTFQTESIRRVKIGVGKPRRREDIVDYVLSPFPSRVREDVTAACQNAVARVVELIRHSAHHR